VEFAQAHFVVDGQNGFGAADGGDVHDARDRAQRRAVHAARQVDAEGGASARFGFDVDVPAALADEAVGKCEAEAGAFVRRFAAEERFEDVGENVFGNAGAGVFHAERDNGAGFHAAVAVFFAGLDFEGEGRDGQRAFVRHRVAGVDGEVHH